MLGDRALGRDDLSCEWNALAALGPTPHPGIGLARAGRPGARGGPNIFFTNGIADANDHRFILSLASGDIDIEINSQDVA